jgi:hypothetical protein
VTTVAPRADSPYDDGIQDRYPTYVRRRAEADFFAPIGFAALPTTVTPR